MPWVDSDGSQHSSSPDWRGQSYTNSQWVEPPKPVIAPIDYSSSSTVYRPSEPYVPREGGGYSGAGGLMVNDPVFKAFVFVVKWGFIAVASVLAVCLGLVYAYTALNNNWNAKNASGPMVYSATEFEISTFISRLRGKPAFLAGREVIVNADVTNLTLYSYQDLTINGRVSGSHVSSTLGTLKVADVQNSTLTAHQIVVTGTATNTKQVVLPQPRLPRAKPMKNTR